MWQSIAVGIIVALAIVYVARLLWQSFFCRKRTEGNENGNKNGCEGCSGCVFFKH